MNTSHTAELQHLFDTSLNHIRRQGKPSMSDVRSKIRPFRICMYKTEQGLGCAAAPFITQYTRAMEYVTWGQVARMFPAKVDPLAAKHSRFVTELQKCHDLPVAANTDDKFMQNYEDRMRNLALYFGLVYTPPSEKIEPKPESVV